MHIHDRLRKLLPETIKIDSLASHNYLSQWTVSQGPCVGIIKVHYNGRHKITSVLLERLSEGDWSVPLREAAHRLKGVSVAGAAPPAKDVVARQHPAFHQAIQARSESLGIRVCEVDDLTAFHTRYRFERDDDSFRVNYYFDGGERFTKMDPETGLPEHLLQVLDQLHRPNHN
jgi:hypothetical protein